MLGPKSTLEEREAAGGSGQAVSEGTWGAGPGGLCRMDLWLLCCLVWEALQDSGLKSQLGHDRCFRRIVLAGTWVSRKQRPE